MYSLVLCLQYMFSNSISKLIKVWSTVGCSKQPGPIHSCAYNLASDAVRMLPLSVLGNITNLRQRCILLQQCIDLSHYNGWCLFYILWALIWPSHRYLMPLAHRRIVFIWPSPHCFVPMRLHTPASAVLVIVTVGYSRSFRKKKRLALSLL